MHVDIIDDARPGTVLPTLLQAIVGKKHLLTGVGQTRRYTKGYRFGSGPVRAVVRPGSLVELWRVLAACTRTGAIVIMQSANTGLTGGSTPNGRYDRPVVLINTLRIKGIYPIADGRQVVCLPGTTLNELEAALRPFGRDPHSVIGSSCLGASVFGGICNNSGGALVQRGPAYTELALYARVDENHELQLVNHLGIDLEGDPEDVLGLVEAGRFDADLIRHDEIRHASDHRYHEKVRMVDEPTPARFNADPSRLFEASGSAGRVALLAVRLDTFPKEERTATFYLGTNDPAELTRIRRDILQSFTVLPISGEYIHRDAFDLADRYGKDTVVAIEKLGTARIPTLFALKARVDGLARKVPFVPANASDRLLQAWGGFLGDHLPPRLRDYRDRFEHHLILKMGGDGIDEARTYFAELLPTTTSGAFECSPREADKAFLHRFAVAGAAVRYRALYPREVEDIIAIDVALRRDESDWFENLPDEIGKHCIAKIYYGHFFCHVFHQDYVVARGTDPHLLEMEMLAILDRRGAEYPAEHNVGHLYTAKPSLVEHYRTLDPCNAFNPGIGGTPRDANWKL